MENNEIKKTAQVSEKKTEKKPEKKAKAIDIWRDVLPFLLAVCVIFLLLSHSERAKEVEQLQEKVEQQADLLERVEALEKTAEKHATSIINVGGWINDVRDLVNSLHNLEESGTVTENNNTWGG